MVAPRHHHSFEDYLAVEEMSSVRHEFLNGEIFAMAGGTPEHAALSAAVVTSLGIKLRGGRCRPYSSDLRVRVRATGLATYPDAAVICGEPERDPDSPTHITNPTLLVEVLSPSTEDYDRGEKREHFQQVESLREYLLIRQDRREIEVFTRVTGWKSHSYTSGSRIVVESLGIEIAVDDIYNDAGVARPL